MIAAYAPSRRGAPFRHAPDFLHKRFPVLWIAEGAARGGRFARKNEPRISLPILQLMDFSPEHTSRGRHNHGVKDFLEVLHRSLQAGARQHALKNLLPLNLDDPLTVAGLERNGNLHPHVLCATGLGCTDCIHFP